MQWTISTALQSSPVSHFISCSFKKLKFDRVVAYFGILLTCDYVAMCNGHITIMVVFLCCLDDVLVETSQSLQTIKYNEMPAFSVVENLVKEEVRCGCLDRVSQCCMVCWTHSMPLPLSNDATPPFQ